MSELIPCSTPVFKDNDKTDDMTDKNSIKNVKNTQIYVDIQPNLCIIKLVVVC